MKLPLVRCARIQTCLLTEAGCGQRWLNATPLEAEGQFVSPHLRVCVGCDDGKNRAYLGVRREPRPEKEEEDWLHRDMARRAEWSNTSHLLKALHELTDELLTPFYDPKQALRDQGAATLGLLQLRECHTAAELRHRVENTQKRRQAAKARLRAYRVAEEARRTKAAQIPQAPKYPTKTAPDISPGYRRYYSHRVPNLDGSITVDVLWDPQGYWHCTLKIPKHGSHVLYVRPTLTIDYDPTNEEGCLVAARAIFDQSVATPLVPRNIWGHALILRQTATAPSQAKET